MDDHTGMTTNARSRAPLSIAYLVFVALLVSFFAGYLLHEGAASAAHGDLTVFHIPAFKTIESKPLAQALQSYSSATTPLFHLLSVYGPFRYDQPSYGVASTLLCVAAVGVFALLLAKRFGFQPEHRPAILLFAAVLLVSPYYRTQAFWPSTDNMATALTLLTLLSLAWMESDTKHPLLCFLGAALASALTFYTRQNFLWLIAYVALVLLLRGTIHRAWVLIFVPLMIPAVALFRLWHGLTPPRFQQHHEGLALEGVAFIFFSILFAAIPFLAAQPHAVSAYFRSRGSWVPDLSFGLLFLLLKLLTTPSPFYTGGELIVSGIIIKMLDFTGKAEPFLYSLLVIAGAAVASHLFRQVNWQSRALMVLLIGSAIMIRVSFQRYYDPLLLIVFLGAFDRAYLRRHFTTRAAAYTLILETGMWIAKAIH
ncbi:hypothetical protein [Terriglobus tenax]|uniref:hypothetical protein n=1 Tax=Terriglobus tenax TaxID=1111115 RepID=UPI0021DF44AE|nr:hypothetical protein [Terriglobus tenax]